MTMESTGLSADDTLSNFEERTHDPESTSDKPNKLSTVWLSSDNLRKLLRKQGIPSEEERNQLTAALVYHVSTILLYWRIDLFLKRLEAHEAPSKTATLYILLFPGEAKDNTGLKDLNEKVIGQWWSAELIRRRWKAIDDIFSTGDDTFMVVAQTYKTAYILTYKKKREDFAERLKTFDKQLRQIFLQILKAANEDATASQKKEIKKLEKKLKKKSYRFDFFFGLRTLNPGSASRLENVYLLITEALKGAAIARYVAKIKSIDSKPVKDRTPQIEPDKPKLDGRGKEYNWKVYFNLSNTAEKIKAFMMQGYTYDDPYVLNEIYIDTVWTDTFVKRKNLFWGHPDVIRDVRKRKLENAPMKKGNVTYSLPYLKAFLELWLVVLNLLDFVKSFESNEFRTKLQKYHDEVLEVLKQVGTPSKDIDWGKLEKVLTHDLRLTKKIAKFETASEFQFYAFAADHMQRICFSMDVRDMGIELMLRYEHSNREVGYHKYSDIDLMEETFRASDSADKRRRFTHNCIVDVFKTYYDRLARNPGTGRAARAAFGMEPDEALGTFEESVQIMLGGDEFYVAAHPLFARYVHNIVSDLDGMPYNQNRTINLRASVAFSRAKRVDPKEQRTEIQLSHQEAMRLAEEAPATLKSLERTQRRIERLIDMIERNDTKKNRAPGYRAELEKLPLMKLFARVKHKKATRLPSRDYEILLRALQSGDIKKAEKKNFELVDFNGNVINGEKLENDAKALEDKVRRDVGVDNVRGHPPPVTKMPKWIGKLIDCWADRKGPICEDL